MTGFQDSTRNLLVRAAVAGLDGPRDALARQVLQGVGAGGGDGLSLESVIGRRARVAAVEALDDPAAFQSWLAAPDSPALLQLEAATIAGQLFDAGGGKTAWLRAALEATCAVVLTEPRGTFAIGTGVVVQASPPVVLTNRHVVEGLLSAPTGLGLKPRDGLRLDIAFGNVALADTDRTWRLEVLSADVRDVPDMALLHLADPPSDRVLSPPQGPVTQGTPGPRLALVVGFPASPAGQLERQLFQRPALLGRKTISVGLLRFDFNTGSFPDLDPTVLWHDCATCAGFSGSGVFTLDDGRLAALHYEGAGATSAGFANLAVDLGQVPLGLPAPVAPAAPGAASPAGPGPVVEAAQVPATAGAMPVAQPVPHVTVLGSARALSVQHDLPDPRDLPYVPDLADLKPRHLPPPGLPVADQGAWPTCVGHALAAAINLQLSRRGAGTRRASPRMLYEIARAHDDLPDASGGGSTLRGAIKGFFHNGVVAEEPPAVEQAPAWGLTRDRAKAAAGIQLGTYRRVGRDFDALHAAIRDSGAVLASARIHGGWTAPVKGRIRRGGASLGGHAFVIVGYDRTGLIVLNSWGEGWGGWNGRPGLAHWSYGDAYDNLLDAWVLRLAAPSVAVARVLQADRSARASTALRRADVIGHLLPLSDGKLHVSGKFGFADDVHAETAAYLRQVAADKRPKYRDLLILCHDLTADRAQVAERTNRLRAICKPLRIWPMSITLETAIGRALEPVVAGALAGLSQISSPALRQIHLVEEVGPVVRSLWARLPFEISEALAADRPGGAALARIHAAAKGLRLCIVGEGLGSMLAGWLVGRSFASAKIDGFILLDPVLPDADFRALIAPALYRADPMARFGETHPESRSRDYSGSGLSRAAFLAEALARPFHSGAENLPIPYRRLPSGLEHPGALDRNEGVLALAEFVRAGHAFSGRRNLGARSPAPR